MEKGLLTIGIVLLLGASHYLGSQETRYQVSMSTQFNEWKQKYHVVFSDRKVELYRLKIFTDNFNSINQFNQDNSHTYQQKLNKFAHLTEKEFTQTYLNLQVPLTTGQQQQMSTNFVYNGNAIDWAQKGKVPSIKDQGQCGSCWAFSAVGALEINTDIYFNQKVSLSEQDLVDCAGPYGNAGCDGGWMDSAFDYVQANGLATGDEYPYTAKDGSCKDVRRQFNRVTGVVDLNGCEEVSQAILGQAVSVGVDATNWRFYDSGVFNDCKKYINHGVVVVGIDENGVWKIRNSWGNDWGAKGYIQLSQGDTCGICVAASYPVLA